MCVCVVYVGKRKEEGRTVGGDGGVFKGPSSSPSKINDHSSNARSRAKAIVGTNDNANDAYGAECVCLPSTLRGGHFSRF